jgi:hypothetical protein
MAVLVGVVAAVIVALAVFAIAAGVVGREARRLDAEVRRPVFDVDEAVAYVADHLPFEVSAVLSYDDVRRILGWHLEYLRLRASSSNGHGPRLDGPVIVGGAETVDYVLERSRAVGAEYTPAQVHAVLEAQMGYLESIDAVAPVEEPDGGGHDPSGGRESSPGR